MMQRRHWIIASAASALIIAGCQAAEPAGEQASAASSAGAAEAPKAGAATPSGAAQAAQAAQAETSTERPIRMDEVEERADMSFSSYPLREETLNLNAQGFTLVPGSCEGDGIACSWRDGAGVIHVLDANNVLYIKMVNAADFGSRPIAALGIGTARDRAAVLRNVSRHLLGTTLDCREAGDAGEGEGIASCGAMLGEGWIKLLFGPDNQLISARIDAYQAN